MNEVDHSLICQASKMPRSVLITGDTRMCKIVHEKTPLQCEKCMPTHMCRCHRIIEGQVVYHGGGGHRAGSRRMSCNQGKSRGKDIQYRRHGKYEGVGSRKNNNNNNMVS